MFFLHHKRSFKFIYTLINQQFIVFYPLINWANADRAAVNIKLIR